MVFIFNDNEFNSTKSMEGYVMDKTELFMIITFCTILYGTLFIVEKGLA